MANKTIDEILFAETIVEVETSEVTIFLYDQLCKARDTSYSIARHYNEAGQEGKFVLFDRFCDKIWEVMEGIKEVDEYIKEEETQSTNN